MKEWEKEISTEGGKGEGSKRRIKQIEKKTRLPKSARPHTRRERKRELENFVLERTISPYRNPLDLQGAERVG